MLLNATPAVLRGVLALVFMVGLASVSMAQPSADLSQKATGATSATEMVTIAQQNGHVRVIVLFDSPVLPSEIRPEAANIANVMSQVAAVQDAIIAAHFGSATTPIEGQGFARGITRFPITPGFAVNVNAPELEAFAADPRIVRIQHDRPEPPVLNESVPLIGMPAAYAAGATGTGRTVAVLDTGVKATHEFLNGKVTAEACFSNSGGGGGAVTLCPNGTASQTGVGAADANTAQCNNGAAADANLCYHGTHVAGIAAGNNTSPSSGEPPNGVAKFSNIFAIQVFTRFNDAASCSPSAAPCVRSFISDLISALNHVFANLNPGGAPVASVNMSLGGGLNSGTCDGDTRKPVIDSLRSAGVLTAIASGNDGSTSQISAPGCISTAVTVGSTTKADAISSFSNMSSVVDLLAPGGENSGNCTFTGSQFIVGPGVTNGGSTTAYFCLVGTSMATPHVAGAIAAIKSACPGATTDAIENALKSTGTSITDNRSGGTQTKPRIRVDLAVQQCPTLSVTLQVTSLTPNLTSPQHVGTAITWTATVTGGSGSYQYQFFRRRIDSGGYVVVQPYGAGASYTWTPGAGDVGDHQIAVWVRNAGSSATVEAGGVSAVFTITASSALPQVTGVTPDRTSPQPVGTAITWTATVTGGSGSYQYQFFRRRTDSGGYVVVQSYGASASYTWTPGAGDVGDHQIAVWVRNAGSAAAVEAGGVSAVFTITP